MFTGIVEETGKILKIEKTKNIWTFTIRANKVAKGLKIGDSMAISGVCLTIVKLMKKDFVVNVVKETLNVTTLGAVKEGDYINLERPLSLNSRLDGHFVTGHVDCMGEIVKINEIPGEWIFLIKIDKKWMPYVVNKGSIAVEGISLTVVHEDKDKFSFTAIPHTLEITNLKYKKPGHKVNIETDLIGKYILKQRTLQ